MKSKSPDLVNITQSTTTALILVDISQADAVFYFQIFNE